MTTKFELTKDQARSMMEPIFRRIYGLFDDDIKALNCWLNSVDMDDFNSRPQLTKSNLSITKKNSHMYEVKFDVDHDQVIINVIPETKLIGPPLIRSYSVRENDIWTELLIRLQQFENFIDKSREYEAEIWQEFPMTKKELNYLVMRLIREGVLLKFYQALPTDMYFVVYKQYLLMLCSIRGILRPIRRMGGLTFNIDTGFDCSFQSEILDKLNEYHQIWMNAGNIDRPIIPINIVHL